MKYLSSSNKPMLISGVFFVFSICLKSQNLEISKKWLKEDRKLQLKTDIFLETEYLKIQSDRKEYSNYKTLSEIGNEKYSVDYLNKSLKEELKYMSVSKPLVSGGAGVAFGGLNLSDPKAYFEAGKLRKRYRKMKQITTHVYPTE